MVSITEGFAPIWCQCSQFFRKLPFTFALFLKVSKSELWESISKSSGIKWRDDKKVYLSSKVSASSSEISSIGAVALPVSNSPTSKASCWGIWLTSGDRGALVVAAVKVWLEVRLLALIIGGEERVLLGNCICWTFRNRWLNVPDGVTE